MFRLNRNKQKTNRNSLIGSIFCHFLQPYIRTYIHVSELFCKHLKVFQTLHAQYKYGKLTFWYSFFSVWTHKLRFLAKLLHIPKRAKNLGFFRFFRFFSFFSVCFETEDPPKQFKREYIWIFFTKFRVVSVCFALMRNRSVCFGCFDIGSKHRNKPKFFVFGFTKQTETNAKQILFRFVSVGTEIYFCLFRGHPNANLSIGR
jgi:hypothetical protein